MITDNIEAHSRSIIFDLGALKKRWIEKVIPAVRKGKFEPMFFSKAEKDIQEGAAGCFVGLHEHNIHFGSTGLLRAVCGRFGVELGWAVGTGVRHWKPTETNTNKTIKWYNID